MENYLQFTDEDKNSILPPEYYASQRITEKLLESVDIKSFENVIKKITDDIKDKLWEDVEIYLLSDTEINLASKIRHMVEQTVNALLTGEEWAMRNYPYADYSKGEKIRKEIAKHGENKILMMRINDLEKEVISLKENLDFYRSRI